MKAINLVYILLLTLVSCAVPKKTSKSAEDNLSKLTFRHYFSMTEEGEGNFNILQDSVLAAAVRELGVDSSALSTMSLSITEVLKATPETEIHLELDGNMVWKYTTEYGKMIGDFQRIDIENGILFYHAKIDKSKMYRQVELSESLDNYSMEEFLEDRKEIMGYNCHKVIIRQKEQPDEDDFPIKLGDTIYEMYVTKEIDLPAYVLNNFGKKFSDFFPLEMKIKSANIAGNMDIYEIKEIIKK